ncbi:MAG: hypothetical protein L3K26_11705, partial [Candidatus Hydrogenedentes bacterium]|nr:hypothetical protein [Candidatus Hydrogenedentota bacterium]
TRYGLRYISRIRTRKLSREPATREGGTLNVSFADSEYIDLTRKVPGTMKHLHLISKLAPAQEDGFNLEFLVLLISPFLAVYAAAGQFIRLFNPDFQKDFIGPDQHSEDAPAP